MDCIIQLDNNGIPRTINKRVKVNMIEVKYSAGDSAEDIAVADVYAALAYFHDPRDYFKERRKKAQHLMEQHGINGEELKAKIQARMDAQEDA